MKKYKVINGSFPYAGSLNIKKRIIEISTSKPPHRARIALIHEIIHELAGDLYRLDKDSQIREHEAIRVLAGMFILSYDQTISLMEKYSFPMFFDTTKPVLLCGHKPTSKQVFDRFQLLISILTYQIGNIGFQFPQNFKPIVRQLCTIESVPHYASEVHFDKDKITIVEEKL